MFFLFLMFDTDELLISPKCLSYGSVSIYCISMCVNKCVYLKCSNPCIMSSVVIFRPRLTGCHSFSCRFVLQFFFASGRGRWRRLPEERPQPGQRGRQPGGAGGGAGRGGRGRGRGGPLRPSRRQSHRQALLHADVLLQRQRVRVPRSHELTQTDRQCVMDRNSAIRNKKKNNKKNCLLILRLSWRR